MLNYIFFFSFKILSKAYNSFIWEKHLCFIFVLAFVSHYYLKFFVFGLCWMKSRINYYIDTILNQLVYLDKILENYRNETLFLWEKLQADCLKKWNVEDLKEKVSNYYKSRTFLFLTLFILCVYLCLRVLLKLLVWLFFINYLYKRFSLY